MKLSEHFHLSEFVRSSTATRHNLNNVPPPEVVRRLQMLCLRVLEPLRRAVDGPIHVSSGYRSAEVNRLVGGSMTSDHIRGCAADIYSSTIPPEDLHAIIQSRVPEWDQLYLHKSAGFVHVSYRTGSNRNMVLPDKE